MKVVNFVRSVVSGVFCGIAALLGLCGLLCLKLGNDCVELAIMLAPKENDCDKIP